MPRDTGQEIKVGVFVAVGLAIFALFILALTGVGFRGGQDIYKVRFKNIAGLENGSVVRLGGLKIGRVESVRIAEDDPRMMEAVIYVEEGSPIRKNSHMQVTSIGLTGSMYLAVSLGSPDSPLLKPGSVIIGQEAASFQDVINEAQNAAAKLGSVLEGVDKTAEVVLTDIREMVNSAKEKVTSILATSDRVATRAENILSEKNEQNIRRFLASLADAADKLEGNIGPAAKEFQVMLKRARKSLDVVDRASNSFGDLSRNASDFVVELKKRLASTDRVLARMDKVGEGLEKVVASGEGAVQELTRAIENELRLFRGDLKKEVAEAGTTVRSEFKALGSQARTTLSDSGKNLDREIQETGGALREEVAGVGSEAKTAIRKGGEKLSDALAAIEGAADRVDQFLGANQKDLRQIVVNFRSLSKRVDDILHQISGGKGSENIKGAAEEMRLALKRAHSLMSQLDDMVANHREDVQILISDLRDTANNLNEFTANLKERPSSLILGAPPEPRSFEK